MLLDLPGQRSHRRQVVIDKVMATLGHRDDVRAKAADAEVLTVMILLYLSGPLSDQPSPARPALGLALETLGAVFARGDVFLIDGMRSRLPPRPRPVLPQGAGAGLLNARPRASSSSAAANSPGLPTAS